MNPITIASVLACVVVWFDFLRVSKKRQRENEVAPLLNHTGLVPAETKAPRMTTEDSFSPTMFWVSIIGGSVVCLGIISWLIAPYSHYFLAVVVVCLLVGYALRISRLAPPFGKLFDEREDEQ